jgi:5-methylthioribose kinase
MKAREILLKAGFDSDFADQVKTIVKKENIFTNPEAQTLEDVVCLVFLEFYLDEFMNDKTELNMVPIILKTWNKMSEKGHQETLKIKYSDAALPIIKKALGL